MNTYQVSILPVDRTLTVPAGASLLQILQAAQLHPDIPCGGNGTCGKCKVLIDGMSLLACQYHVNQDITVALQTEKDTAILTTGLSITTHTDGENNCALAFDIGTATVVCYLLDGHTGETLRDKWTVLLSHCLDNHQGLWYSKIE